MLKVLYINNDGGGFAAPIEVEPGTTVAALFEQKMPGREAEDFLIRVNRQVVPADQVLQDGDRVGFTPTKVAGA